MHLRFDTLGFSSAKQEGKLGQPSPAERESCFQFCIVHLCEESQKIRYAGEMSSVVCGKNLTQRSICVQAEH